MTCICGYENKHGEVDEKYNLVNDPDGKFIEIHGNFAIPNFDYDESVILYACPKCGTVKIDTNMH